MARAMWTVTIRVQLQNGQSGAVELNADQLVTMREVQGVFDRAIVMCKQLGAEPPQQQEQHFRPRVVGE
jgi:hypothetical protein